MNQKCIWYISKYLVIPSESSLGARGFLILEELSKLGHKCVVITSDSIAFSKVTALKESLSKKEINGVEVICLRTYKYKIAKSFKRLISWLHFEWKLLFFSKRKVKSPDTIIVSSLSLLTILNGLILKYRYKCRLVFEVRDIWPLTLTEEGGFKKSNVFIRILNFVEKIGYKYSDHIVGTMPNLKEHVEHVIGREKRVSCIPMGIDINSIEKSSPLDSEFYEKYLSHKSFKIIYAGSIGISNALDTFLNCAQLMKDNKNIKFIVVGDGDLKKNYQRIYGDLRNLIFVPKVPKEKVQSVLSYADVLYLCVHKSKVWEYGQSLNKLVDYMYAGKPIIASFSGFHSMINEAKCGSFISSNDVEKLADEVLSYSKLPKKELILKGNRGREWILNNRRYSSLARKYEKIIFPS